MDVRRRFPFSVFFHYPSGYIRKILKIIFCCLFLLVLSDQIKIENIDKFTHCRFLIKRNRTDALETGTAFRSPALINYCPDIPFDAMNFCMVLARDSGKCSAFQKKKVIFIFQCQRQKGSQIAPSQISAFQKQDFL